jgi:hypothetical protein
MYPSGQFLAASVEHTLPKRAPHSDWYQVVPSGPTTVCVEKHAVAVSEAIAMREAFQSRMT